MPTLFAQGRNRLAMPMTAPAVTSPNATRACVDSLRAGLPGPSTEAVGDIGDIGDIGETV
jgi:hypothetical protein